MSKFVTKFLVSFLAILVFANLTAYADEAKSLATDPVLEQRVKTITEELRCLVCQNQTIADSHADLAIDLKKQVREKLSQGATDKDITDFMVQRYGDFVLYRPPVKRSTWLLWFGPFLLLAAGFACLVNRLTCRLSATDALPDDSLEYAATLLHAPTETKESL